MKEVTLYLARHGKTIFNETGRMQGWSDTPLNKEGAEAARRLGRGLAREGIVFSEVYSSDLGRAKETAKLILANMNAMNLKIIESEKLRESCYGSHEGEISDLAWGEAAEKLGYRSFQEVIDIGIQEVSHQRMQAELVKSDTTGMAERIEDVQNRMLEITQDICEKMEQKEGGNVLVVSHGVAIITLLKKIGGLLPEQGYLDNASISKIIYSKGEFRVAEVNNLKYIENVY